MERELTLWESDSELVDAARQGDLASFGVLYERYYSMAVGVARCRLRDIHLAEDAAQEAFAIACRTLDTLQIEERFPQWLGTICRRTASRLATCQSNHELLTEEHQQTRDLNQVSRCQDVHDALAMLDETAREIVMLHYFNRLTYAEISAVVQLSSQAVHGRLQRARAKMAELLEPAESKTKPVEKEHD